MRRKNAGTSPNDSDRTMLPDWETNTVLISGLLRQRHPEIVRRLEAILIKHEFPLVTVPGMADIWIRDAAPVQVDDRLFTQFRYFPDYLGDGYRHLITKPEVFRKLEFMPTTEKSQLIIDGGNIVGTRSTATLTDKVFRENPRRNRSDLIEELQQLLRVRNLVIIPQEIDDRIGHADGMIRFVTDDQVTLNDYRASQPRFAKRLENAFATSGVRITRIPYVPENRIEDGIPSAVGNYANFLRVGNLLVIPEYGLTADEVVLNILVKLLPHCCVESLPCRALAREGGALNCATWTIQLRHGSA